MNNKTKILIGILLVAAITAPLMIPKSNASVQIYNMKAMATALEGNRIIDENNVTKSLHIDYIISVTGSPSYTYISSTDLEVPIDLSKLNQVNATTIQAIKNNAYEKYGWNLSNTKILYQPFEKP